MVYELRAIGCPSCNTASVYLVEGYDSVFQCSKCKRIGNRSDFR